MQGSVQITGLEEFKAKLKQAMTFIERDLPDVVGVEGVNHFKESFQNEGFTDSSLTKWAPRRSKAANGRKILTGDTQELGESIDYKKNGNVVTFYSDKLYAQIHNEGGTIQVTDQMRKFFWAKHAQASEGGLQEIADQWKWMALAKKIVIQKRQFMGDSQQLMLNIDAKVGRELDKIFKS